MSIGTQIRVANIPQPVLQALTERALSQTVERYGQPASLFERARQAIEEDVILKGDNQGLVRDGRTWREVDLVKCAHCDSNSQRAICWHKAAVAFASLLAERVPAAQVAATAVSTSSVSGAAAATAGAGPGGPGAGGSGGYGGWSVSVPYRARRGGGGGSSIPRGKGKGRRHCPDCGAVTQNGACHNPRCKRNR